MTYRVFATFNGSDRTAEVAQFSECHLAEFFCETVSQRFQMGGRSQYPFHRLTIYRESGENPAPVVSGVAPWSHVTVSQTFVQVRQYNLREVLA